MTAPVRGTIKRIAPGAYQALREALPVVFFYKRPYENYLRLALRDHPELLAGLNFRDLKRHVADELVDRLAQREHRYQPVTLQLMTEVASMERFPDLERQDDAEVRIAEARKAVAELRRWTDRYASAISEQERVAAERAAATQQADANHFASKVRFKGKNALGLFISVNGFTAGAFDFYAHSTPFLAMDGADLMCVLEQRVRLDDLLRRKKRYANETGHCFFPAQRMLGE
jgi:hypothetical protein